MDTLDVMLAGATVGQAALCASVLLMRSVRAPTGLPLAGFFCAFGAIASAPLLHASFPLAPALFPAIAAPTFFLLGPMLWFYVEGLTSETAWRPRTAHVWHYMPALLGLMASAMIAAMNPAARSTMFLQGELPDGIFPPVVALVLFVLVIGWVGQSGYYVARILYRLAAYGRRIRDLFASNENRELDWLAWLVFFLGGSWLLATSMLVSENFLGLPLAGHWLNGATALILVWFLGLWGLRQKPGFEGRYSEFQAEEENQAEPYEAGDRKYLRSALGPDQAARIAAKIERAMREDQAYLDPALSLQRLASQIGTSPNHISQTLNETIGECFFDYVNRWRVLAAQPQIMSGSETVLAIALSVGFNARSSFYKAFKRVTGQTPSQYRAQQLSSAGV